MTSREQSAQRNAYFRNFCELVCPNFLSAYANPKPIISLISHTLENLCNADMKTLYNEALAFAKTYPEGVLVDEDIPKLTGYFSKFEQAISCLIKKIPELNCP